MNALTADALVESLKKLDEPLGARCVANAREFAAKIKAGGGKQWVSMVEDLLGQMISQAWD